MARWTSQDVDNVFGRTFDAPTSISVADIISLTSVFVWFSEMFAVQGQGKLDKARRVVVPELRLYRVGRSVGLIRIFVVEIVMREWRFL